MSRAALQSLGEVGLVLDSIEAKLVAQDRLDDQRRLLDDARYKEAQRCWEELKKQTAAQAERTSVLESDWRAFFTNKGAFPEVVRTVSGHGKKIDRLTWLAAVGFGILITLQAIVELHK